MRKEDESTSQGSGRTRVRKSQKLLSQRVQTIKSQKGKADLTLTYGDAEGQIVYVGTKISTVDELLADAKIDLRIWEVAEVQVNNWEVAGKRKVAKADQLWKTGLRQIRVRLKRKAPKSTQDGILSLLKHFPKATPSKTRKHQPRATHLLELSLVDTHIGKLAWQADAISGREMRVVIDDYRQAVSDMLARCVGFPIEQIVLPIGNDFYNVDNWAKTTARGTLVDCTDEKVTTMFRAGFELIRDTVERCRQVAPVKLVWVPGNHDPATSWYLTELARTHFRDDSSVEVENSHSARKYMLYGKNLIGWNHGDQVSLDKLAALMPIEAAQFWSKTAFRFIRVGHWHKAKQIRFVNRDTFHGVEVSVIPSLSVTDKWHHENGYVGNLRTAECTLWDRDQGHVATFTVEARSAVLERNKRASHD
jgi:hypothetical protein